jgi:glyoxylase-like metal-dependent hydrolase (beta-lactamase superfamily II)
MSDETKAKAKASHQAMFVTGRAALAPYLAADRVQTFTAGAEIFPGIRTIATPGHTPGHTQYEFTSAGHMMLFIGDMIHVAEVQLPMPAITIDYDANEAEAAKTRIETLAMLARTHELVAAPHISFPGLGHIYKQGDGYGWVPIPYAAHVSVVRVSVQATTNPRVPRGVCRFGLVSNGVQSTHGHEARLIARTYMFEKNGRFMRTGAIKTVIV